MKIKILAAVFVSSLVLQQSAFAQGALTPPGAPAPAMKTLNQIEARTPISSAPFTIGVPGSYYLTTNLNVSSGTAITIAADNVSLDLNGFTIASSATTHNGSAILLSVQENVSICNGHISSSVTNNITGLVFGGSGFINGIYGNNSSNVRVKNVSVSGVFNDGISLIYGSGTVVESCTVTVAGDDGINAESVSDSVAINCGSTGINGSTVNNCKGIGIGNGYGVSTTTANNCSGSGAGTGYGLTATTANNCAGFASGSGIGLWASDVATGCSGFSTSGIGLSAFIANGCRGSKAGNVSSLSVVHNVNSF